VLLIGHFVRCRDRRDQAVALVATAPDAPIAVMVTCSHDAGVSWERPRALSLDLLLRCSPYGKIVAATDGTLLMTLYGEPQATLLGGQGRPRPPRGRV
jgi:hypothetical protein